MDADKLRQKLVKYYWRNKEKYKPDIRTPKYKRMYNHIIKKLDFKQFDRGNLPKNYYDDIRETQLKICIYNAIDKCCNEFQEYSARELGIKIIEYVHIYREAVEYLYKKYTSDN